MRLNTLASSGEEADEAFAFWDYGPELSRRFRALKVWMLLKGVGLDSLGEAIESNLACARHLESMVRASDDFEMVAPGELSILCFRHRACVTSGSWPPRRLIKTFNEKPHECTATRSQLVSLECHARRSLRSARVRPNYRTTLRDMEILLDDLRRVARSLAAFA